MEFTLKLRVKRQCDECHGFGSVRYGMYMDECHSCQGSGEAGDTTVLLDTAALDALRHALAGEWLCKCGTWFVEPDPQHATGYCSAACFTKYDAWSKADEDSEPCEFCGRPTTQKLPVGGIYFCNDEICIQKAHYHEQLSRTAPEMCDPMTEAEQQLLQGEGSWRLDSLRNNHPSGTFYCERCGNHIPYQYVAYHQPLQPVCSECGQTYDKAEGGQTLCPLCLDAQDISEAEQPDLADEPYEPIEVRSEPMDYDRYR